VLLGGDPPVGLSPAGGGRPPPPPAGPRAPPPRSGLGPT